MIVISLDDLYLTHEDQLALEARHPSNTLLHGRGLPGTHDLPLAIDLFQSLSRVNDGLPELTVLKIPRYDKSAWGGAGDRKGFESISVTSPLHVVLFEGWMVGFAALESTHIKSQCLLLARDGLRRPTSYLSKHELHHLLDINQSLQAYTQQLWPLLDQMIQLQPMDLEYIWKWRLQVSLCFPFCRCQIYL